VRPTWVAVLLPLAITACGTTVPLTGHVTSVGGPSGSSGLEDAQATTPRSAVPPRGESTALRPRTSISPGGSAGEPGVTTASVPQASLPSGPVLIGVEHSSDFNATTKGLGFGGVSSGDMKALAQQIVADVNRAGGIFGHELRAVFHDTSTASVQSDPNTAAAEACTAFTQDTRVSWAVVAGYGNESDCLAQGRVPSATAGSISPRNADATYLRSRAPYVYNPPAFEFTRLVPLWMDRLAAQGFFPRGARIGVLHSNHDSERREVASLLAELRRRDIAVTSRFEYDESATRLNSSISSAVLQFSSDRVDHVISVDGAVNVFMLTAEQQQYRPRYALSTYMGPSSATAVVAPPAQLRGAVGVGWQPVSDLPVSQPVDSPGRRQCENDLRATGQSLTSSSALFIAYSVCDAIRLFVRLSTLAGSLDPAALQAAQVRLGSSFSSALNLRSAYGLHWSHNAGAGGVRDLRFDDDCSCFEYAAEEVHEPS